MTWFLMWALTATAAATVAQSDAWWRRRARQHLLGDREAARGPRVLPAVRRAARRLPGPRARRVALADDVAPTLEEVARQVAAGCSLAQALNDLPQHRPERPFAALVAERAGRHQLGVPLAEALTGPHPDTAPETALAFTVLEVVARHGGAGAVGLGRAAAAVRERRAVVAERAVQSAQARLSARVMGSLPLLFTGWSVAGDRRVAAFLIESPLGWACLAGGLGLDVAGWVWMRRLVRGGP